jgi:hypothetical protein
MEQVAHGTAAAVLGRKVPVSLNEFFHFKASLRIEEYQDLCDKINDVTILYPMASSIQIEKEQNN